MHDFSNAPMLDMEADDREPFKRYSSAVLLKASPSRDTIGPEPEQQKAEVEGDMRPSSSVFGLDKVMEREMDKLEKILKMEEAEKKMEAERQRVREARRKEKEARRKAKEAKRRRREKEKQKENSTHEYPRKSLDGASSGEEAEVEEVWPPPLESGPLIEVPPLPDPKLTENEEAIGI
jgi:hypothetical protein